MKWVTREQFTEVPPEGPFAPDCGLLKFATVDRDATLEGSRRVRVIASTGAADRENDVIAQAGWQLLNYQKNPVVLFGHDYRSLPVAKAVSLQIDGDRLVMECEFATAEEHPFADVCYKLVKGGYLNAVSVGFRPLKWNYNEERKGLDFLEQELLEVSWVPVPAHPQALVTARDAGIDLTLLRQWHEGLGARLKEIEGPEPRSDGRGEQIKVGSLTIHEEPGESTAITATGTVTLVLPDGAKVDSITVGDFTKTLVNGGTGAFDEPQEKTTGDADALTLDDTAEKIAGLVKQGRVLSAANEGKIRSAVAALTDVLSALETMPDDDGKAVTPPEQKADVPASDALDVEIEKDGEDLTTEEVETLRVLIRQALAEELTPLTGRVY